MGVIGNVFLADCQDQYNSRNHTVSTNLRLRWEYDPGNELFVVYTDENDTNAPGFPRVENRAFAVKIDR